MREIKFRCWNHKSGIMYYDIDLMCGHACKDGHYLCYSEKDVIMQYTGLKDKHGKEIYEGDILRSFLCDIDVVEWANIPGAWSIKSGEDWGMIFPCFCEVIGNIYENGELLES